MKRILLALLLATALTTTVSAKTPKEVAAPYKAYVAALKADNKKDAADFAYKAWQAAETVMGDHKTTGDLASNYADIKVDGKTSKNQIKAAIRAMELASLYSEEGNAVFMERGVSLIQYYMGNKNRSKARKQANDLIDFAKANGLDKSVLYAEVLTIKASTLISARKGKDIIELTDEATEVFENPSDNIQSAYPLLAKLINGFGHEYEENILKATLSYQAVMEVVGHLEYDKYPVASRAFGRWTHMRGRLQTAGELDDAKEVGVCDCWPFDSDRNESVKPIERFPPNFPKAALRYSVSGYTVVQFDLDDEGNTINQQAIVSWPPDTYEKAALKSLARWKYSPRAEGETDIDRSNLITTIRFNINDRFGNPVY